MRSIKARLMEERANLEEKRKSLRERFSIILITTGRWQLYLTIACVRLNQLERRALPLMGRLEESTEPVGRETVNKDSHFQDSHFQEPLCQDSICQDSLVKEKGQDSAAELFPIEIPPMLRDEVHPGFAFQYFE